MNDSTDEEDGEEENSKVDKDVCTLNAYDLPEEVDSKHTVDTHDGQEQGEWNSSKITKHKKVI